MRRARRCRPPEPPSVCTTIGIAGVRRDAGREIVGDEGLRPADGIEFHRDEPARSRFGAVITPDQPVGHDLDAGIALERHERAIDGGERADAAIALVRLQSTRRAPACTSGFASRAASARVASNSMSRSSDPIARR